MHDDSTTVEEWRPVPGHDGYEVSNLGRVRSVTRTIRFKDGRWRTAPGRILRQSGIGRKREYQKVALGLGPGMTRTVHLLVLRAFHGDGAPGMWCRHLDGNPRNNRADNLAWGTPQDNADDTVRHGRTTRGERNVNARLTADDVREIRRLRAGGMMLREIGDRFNVRESTVCRIVKRDGWAHVE